jgi:phosphotriesterase-related protein
LTGRTEDEPSSTLASGMVPTYRGPKPATSLGVTLMHEHVFVRDHELERNGLAPEWETHRAVEQAVADLTALHRHGVGTIVDLTVIGLGRDVGLVDDVARRVPVNIIASTGIYAAGSLPLFFRFRGPGRLIPGPDPLIGLFVRDIEHGIAGSAIKAGMIKVMTEGPSLTEAEERLLTAAAEAHQRTGVSITTHSDPILRNGIVQQAFLIDRGVDATRIIIGHSGDSGDLDYLRSIMDKGSTIGMDRFGMRYVLDDEARITTVAALVAGGYADRMVLSHDAACYSHVTPPSWRSVHAPDWRMDHLLRRIVAGLRSRGVPTSDIDQMLVVNPGRLLPAVESGAATRSERQMSGGGGVAC